MIFVFALIACSTHQVNYEAISSLPIKNIKHPQKHVFSSGQPTKEELSALAETGVKHIVNLRPPHEQVWNEEAYVTTLGMTYHSIPVEGASGITIENASALSDLLDAIGAQPTLVHCSSGNRVGGLVSLDEHLIKGKTIESAITTGKEWGLTGLESVVREKLVHQESQ